MMASSRGTLYAFGRIARRQEASERERGKQHGPGRVSHVTPPSHDDMVLCPKNSLSRPPLNLKNDYKGCLRRRHSVCADAGSAAKHAVSSSPT